MPVRIYDISKKLGLDNKVVLAKAKELGFTAARVASSSLDKITAEYLEQQILLEHPELAAVVRMKLRRVSIRLLFMALLPRLGLFRRAASASIVFAFHCSASLTMAAGGCNPDI